MADVSPNPNPKIRNPNPNPVTAYKIRPLCSYAGYVVTHFISHLNSTVHFI